jgi:predicted Ser/Thr protein kinase
MKQLRAENRRKAIEMISKNGKELGRGTQGIVYQIDPTKVVKISFGPRSIAKEVRLSKKAAKAGIGPKIYDSGAVAYGGKGEKIQYFVMEKLDIPSRFACGTTRQKQLFKIFSDVSKLGIALNDGNFENVMYSNKKKRFYIIDYGKAKMMRNSREAFQMNMRNLISMLKRVVSSKKDKKRWHCSDVSTTMKLIACHADQKTRAHMSTCRDLFLKNKSVKPGVFEEMGQCCNGNPMVNHKCACKKH